MKTVILVVATIMAVTSCAHNSQKVSCPSVKSKEIEYKDKYQEFELDLTNGREVKVNSTQWKNAKIGQIYCG